MMPTLLTDSTQTIVGMSGSFVHNSEEIFKNSDDFNPDRWLGPDSASLERWLVAFSKGPRMCMGQKYV
jgi:cytochrome P450